MRKRSETGALGEELAAKYLAEQGFMVLHRNIRIGHLETDIICENGEYVVLSEGALRNDIGWMKLIDLLPKSIDSQSRYLMTENLFAEALSNEAEHYEYKGNIVDKSQYDEYYQTFLDEYKKIESTQIQLIRWSSIESENRNELVEKMAEALIHTSQDFIDNKK